MNTRKASMKDNMQKIQQEIKHIVFDEDLSIAEGTQVLLNIERIQKHPDYEVYAERYKEFLSNNVNTVFTVEYNNNDEINPLWVCLKEDTTIPKWLFYVGDLRRCE